MTPAEKEKQWARWVGDGLRSGMGWTAAVGVADEALSALEWRIREGRFGSAEMFTPEERAAEFRDLTANRDEWMERAQRAESEVERLKTELAGVERTHHEMLDAKEKHARKAESLLKEALRLLKWWATPDNDSAPVDSTNRLLARARQEGFSDGE